MKAEELRTLDADELGNRLRGARRELYELRFKLAVGQLENHRQILKARKDIARILTVMHQREAGEPMEEAPAGVSSPGGPEAAARTAVAEEDEATQGRDEAAEAVAPEAAAGEEPAPAPGTAEPEAAAEKPARARRGRGRAGAGGSE
jgi:large subunit ribosomal protein L29